MIDKTFICTLNISFSYFQRLTSNFCPNEFNMLFTVKNKNTRTLKRLVFILLFLKEINKQMQNRWDLLRWDTCFWRALVCSSRWWQTGFHMLKGGFCSSAAFPGRGCQDLPEACPLNALGELEEQPWQSFSFC